MRVSSHPMLPLLSVQWLATAALAATTVHDASFDPDYVLRIAAADVRVACETRLSALVNGTSPGPVIRIQPGKDTWIRVYNDMTDQNLTMHWHGLAQRMAPFSDGSPQASQWPIPPQRFFDYEIRAQPDDAGTYFYHSHVGTQALSAAGPLIVDDCGKTPYQYDEERILMFTDYFNKTDADIEAGLLASPFVWSGETHSMLMNGLGVATGHESEVRNGPPGGTRGRYGVGTLSHVDDNTDCTLPVIDVEPGKTYRLRFIGGTGLSFIEAAIEGHENLTVVQVDGSEYNAPVSTDHMQVASGQRFDVLLQTKSVEEITSSDKRSFYIQWDSRERPKHFRGYGVLRYQNWDQVPVLPETPIFPDMPTNKTDWLEYALKPLYPDQNRAPSLEEVTRRLVMTSSQQYRNSSTNTSQQYLIWKLANLDWTERSVQTPALIDIYQRGDAAIPDFDAAQQNHGWDPKTLSFPAKVGEVLEIVLQNTGSLSEPGRLEPHPFHAHGQHYYDMGGGDGIYDPVANEAKMKEMNYTPVRRDTTLLYKYMNKTTAGNMTGWRTWRIRQETPGVWMIHCHVLQHMIMGMQSVWVVGNYSDIIKVPMEEAQGYLTYGGDVYGSDDNSPIVLQAFNSSDSEICKPETQPTTKRCT